ncbi:MAG: NAD-dependent epimerase/dehydratase family protein [Proteiniphilum sp.]|nr:NAD-dependent epimerase/dehydratase family protein [Proteiniphilum sp.]MDD3908681.1 NAD-dependent epimerase/dehydratase family protein [Proteiniphilum sp.]MDD4415715.1 NAD-dependent epimerase/dehydratase family protein [Proteiniphilum sp.]
MKILVTGAAGFIGFHVVRRLLLQGYEVAGLDNINSYYDVRLKFARLNETGISREKIKKGKWIQSNKFKHYKFIQFDLIEGKKLSALFRNERFTHVLNFAAQAGVRYSLENPLSYIHSNIVGFINLLEACRNNPVTHLVYASSSSVYGDDTPVPYKESAQTDHPVSLYAATKKSDELLAYAYGKLFGLPATGIRFFTVYGPWGRPDMAPWLFMSAISKGKPIKIFNKGQMQRDFTFIDDIVEGVIKILPLPPQSVVPHIVYNMGCSSPVQLMDFINVIEKTVGKQSVHEMEEMQPGDVVSTFADTSLLQERLGYKPSTTVETGIKIFYEWFKEFVLT